MYERKDIILAVDYHAENTEVRWFHCASGEERCLNIPTTPAGLSRLVEKATAEASRLGGKVIWIMESTTGWARIKELIGSRAEFIMANVLQMPLPPKAYRRKSDKIDTGRMLREFLNGSLPRSYQPEVRWRELRRLVDSRQDLVERQTAVKNWITHFLHHETWYDRQGLWTQKGMRRLRSLKLSASDRMVLDLKLLELEQLAERRQSMEAAMQAVYEQWLEAQWVDEVRGIGMVTAVSILAHIGSIERFPHAENLISYAGLAPGHRQSDDTRHNGKIGGGGTDSHLRYLLIESMQWVCQIPRYRPAFERARARHGTNIARIIVARMLLRSIFKMLKDKVRFNQVAA
ncbi:IS110 family transposase [uncultured Thiodictyon sp.]|uniref:IS110 family transposase n=1 Tax=uncultured Thiodictyon sp. TaxID=1846217 RepID=UPI0025ED54B2|nr:IS110 family transposase [uncultured Thiodictyon sp.]